MCSANDIDVLYVIPRILGVRYGGDVDGDMWNGSVFGIAIG